MKVHRTTRLIDGEEVCCTDIGCDDFDSAALSRNKVAKGLFTDFWIQYERALNSIPLGQRLPSWIPQNQTLQPPREENNV